MTRARDNRGFHPVIEPPLEHLFIDGCVQIWPDADLKNAHLHGVDVYAVTAFLPWVGAEEAFDALMTWRTLPRSNPNVIIAASASDIRDAKRNGKAALLLVSQDGEFIGGSIGRIEGFYRLGLRMLILAYNRDNLLAGGCADSGNTGLSALGRRVVEECNRVGMLLDGSHMSERATLEMTETSKEPIVFSHSNPKGVVDNPRNITDEQIKACAQRGGVVGVVPWGPLIHKPGSGRRPTVNDLLDAIDYITDLTGHAEAVGLGTDFSLGTYGAHMSDPWGAPNYFANITREFDQVVPPGSLNPERFTEGFDSYPQIVNIVDGLRGRGYEEDDIGAVLGGNFLRVFEQVWK